MLASDAQKGTWRDRLYIPNYQIREAARYADISAKTVVAWHKDGNTLSVRESRAALSYMQLIELAVVAAFRKAGVTLKSIKATRAYVAKELKSEFPFAEFRFKKDGKRLVMDYGQIEKDGGTDKLLRADQNGQFAWAQILGRLHEFEYEDGGVAIRWHLGGRTSDIVIDPRVAFGTPAIGGTPTWVLKGRWEAGESIEEIAEDFGMDELSVVAGLNFEGINLDPKRRKTWAH
jgi:uncharacterized protein (DUF433 family)